MTVTRADEVFGTCNVPAVRRLLGYYLHTAHPTVSILVPYQLSEDSSFELEAAAQL